MIQFLRYPFVHLLEHLCSYACEAIGVDRRKEGQVFDSLQLSQCRLDPRVGLSDQIEGERLFQYSFGNIDQLFFDPRLVVDDRIQILQQRLEDLRR